MVNKLLTGSFSSIEQATGNYKKNNSVNSELKKNYPSFQEILDNKATKTSVKKIENQFSLKFSKHAGERLEERNIELSNEQIKRLEDGTRKAGDKGIKESLVLLDDMAFIVNTQKNIVITAMSQSNSEENIYTNIDGAVII